MANKLMKRVAILAACAVFAACSEYEPVLSEGTENLTDQQLATLREYTRNFTERYGTIDPYHTWGFGEFQSTRSAENVTWIYEDAISQWGYTDYVEFTTAEFNEVIEHLPEHESASDDFNDYEFVSHGAFVIYPIYSITSGDDEIGYYYYNPKTQTIEERTEVVLIENLQTSMTYNDDFITKVEETKTINGETTTGQYPWTSDWNKTFEDVDNKTYRVLTRGYAINVPKGYRVGFWIKNHDYDKDGRFVNNGGAPTYYSNTKLNEGVYYSAVVQALTGNLYFGLEDWIGTESDYDCNDIVFAVKSIDGDTPLPTPVDPDDPDPTDPTEPEDPASCRIMCEDLGSTSDFDFNDIVFDVVSYKQEEDLTYTATILVQAAGGTLPVYIGSVDEANEVHHILLQNNSGSTSTPLNVTKGGKRYPAQKHIVKNLPSTNPSDIPLYGKGTMFGTDDEEAIRICENYRDLGINAPQKICVPTTTRWTVEHGDIGEAYKNFATWVQKEHPNGGFETGSNWTEMDAYDALLMDANPGGGNTGKEEEEKPSPNKTPNLSCISDNIEVEAGKQKDLTTCFKTDSRGEISYSIDGDVNYAHIDENYLIIDGDAADGATFTITITQKEYGDYTGATTSLTVTVIGNNEESTEPDPTEYGVNILANGGSLTDGMSIDKSYFTGATSKITLTALYSANNTCYTAIHINYSWYTEIPENKYSVDTYTSIVIEDASTIATIKNSGILLTDYGKNGMNGIKEFWIKVE